MDVLYNLVLCDLTVIHCITSQNILTNKSEDSLIGLIYFDNRIWLKEVRWLWVSLRGCLGLSYLVLYFI